MINPPRMMIYERFMRGAEFVKELQDVPRAILRISKDYNWEKHNELVNTDSTIQVPLTKMNQFVEHMLIDTGLNRYFGIDDVTIPTTFTADIDASWLSTAFVDNQSFLSIIFKLGHTRFAELIGKALIKRMHDTKDDEQSVKSVD